MHKNNKHIFLITLGNGFFGQTRKPWVSINIPFFISELENMGYSVNQDEIGNIYKQITEIKNQNIFYSFSQKLNQRNFILDIMFELQKDNKIIPSYDLLKSHENKGYQEILKKRNKLDDIKSEYYSNYNDLNFNEIEYPIVLKSLDGSNGNNVFLCRNENELKTNLLKFSQTTIKDKIDLFRRKHFRKEKTFPLYPDYSNKKDYYEYKDYVREDKAFLLQEFIPNQEKDYRVIVMGEKYFVMERFNREGDFRASGSKKFNFDLKPNVELLNKAKLIYSCLSAPCLSLDLIFDERDNSYKLIEFQALHFGISSIIGNHQYFIYHNDWKTRKEKNIKFESVLAESLSYFLGS